MSPKFVSSLGIAFCFVCSANLASAVLPKVEKGAAKALADGWSAFVENKGQWDSRALYLSRVHGANVWITREGPVFDFSKFVSTGTDNYGPDRARQMAGYVVGHVVKMSFVNARPSPVSGASEVSGKYNFFIGNDRTKWAANACGFAEVVAEQLYDGISVRYSIDKGAPRYDVMVAPGADPLEVGMKIEGAYGAEVLSNGNLRIKTSLGYIEERGLLAYQATASGRTGIPCRMVLDGDVLHFDLAKYDRTKTLVIDPLVCSTYLGGTGGSDIPNAIATDSSNDIYLAGGASSIDFPTTVGAYQRVHKVPFVASAYVAKMNPQETGLVYSTLIGGSGFDSAYGLAVDKNHDAYITGTAHSSDFPTTVGAFQRSNKASQGGGATAFVVKFNSVGSAPIYSTFLGGSGVSGQGEAGEGVAVDASGNAFLTGYTYSADFPVTAGVLQKTNKESTIGSYTGFITKLNSTGTHLLYSTFFGGSGDGSFVDGDVSFCIGIDPNDNAYAGGFTYSSDLPVTSTAFQKKNSSAINKSPSGFIVKLNSLGTAVSFCTYIGGSHANKVLALALDSHQNVVATGTTLSTDFPVTPTAYMVWDPETGSSASSPTAIFVAKLAATGSSLLYSTYLGGSGGSDVGTAVTLDAFGNAIVVGQTGSADFPTTAGAFQTVAADRLNGFIAKLNPLGTALLYSTFLGGSGDTGGVSSACNAVALNGLGDVVVAGYTDSDSFPTTTGAFNSKGASGFASTLSFSASSGAIADFVITPNSLTSGAQATGTITLTTSATTDTVFALTSTGPATFPAEVIVPAGVTTANFKLHTEGVNVATTLSIKATKGTITATATAVINPAALSVFNFNQSTVSGGHPVSALILLSGFAGSPSTSVKLSSGSAAVVVEPVVTVPFGADSARTTVNTKSVSATTSVIVTATLGAAKITQTLVVEPAHVALLTVPASCVGGVTVTAKVTLSGPAGPTGDVVVLGSNSADATVPKTVTVPAGGTSVTFSIKTKAVSSAATAVITAFFSGASKTATLLVEK